MAIKLKKAVNTLLKDLPFETAEEKAEKKAKKAAAKADKQAKTAAEVTEDGASMPTEMEKETPKIKRGGKEVEKKTNLRTVATG